LVNERLITDLHLPLIIKKGRMVIHTHYGLLMINHYGAYSANSGRSKISMGEPLFVHTTNGSDCGFSLLLINTTTDYWIVPFD